uniref:Uncharacterized protein n=1 Tax=Anguilla anguilla TaxID=7936 RepID=A0A0E9PBC4_ANGAN
MMHQKRLQNLCKRLYVEKMLHLFQTSDEICASTSVSVDILCRSFACCKTADLFLYSQTIGAASSHSSH